MYRFPNCVFHTFQLFPLCPKAVLASPLNGQFYVIGNPSDVLGGMGQRTIAPRAGPFSLDQSSVQNPKEDRQGWGYTQNTVEQFKTFEF